MLYWIGAGISTMAGDADSGIERACAAPDDSGRNPPESGISASNIAARTGASYPEPSSLMDAVVKRGNMLAALRRVKSNRGSAGVDGMSVDALEGYLREHWPRIKGELLNGCYQPEPVRRVEIPKPDGKGRRQLGIPTVLDRLIQQALHQVLQPVFDPFFSESRLAELFPVGRGERCVRGA